jgi:hypothetical protein
MFVERLNLFGVEISQSCATHSARQSKHENESARGFVAEREGLIVGTLCAYTVLARRPARCGNIIRVQSHRLCGSLSDRLKIRALLTGTLSDLLNKAV